MPISVQCPACKAKLKAPEQALGQTLKCPACKAPVKLAARPPGGVPDKKPQAKAPAPAPKAKGNPAPAKPSAPPAPQQERSAPRVPAPPPGIPNMELDLPVKDEEVFEDFELLDDEPKLKDEDVADLFGEGEPGLKDEGPGLLDENAGLADEPGDNLDFEMVDEEEDEEVFEDFELADEEEKAPDLDLEPAAPARQAKDHDEVVDIDAIEGAEEIEDVVAVEEAEGGFDDLEIVEEEDDLEIVDEEPPRGGGDDPAEESRLLRLQKLFIKAKKGVFKMTSAYTLHDVQTKKLIGEAIEQQDTGLKVARVFGVNNNWVSTRIEVTEGRHNDLVLSVSRPPHLWTKTIEIRDADDEVVGKLEVTPWSQITQKPVWLLDDRGRRRFRMQPQWTVGKYLLQNARGEKLGEMVHEGAYEGKIKFYAFQRGMNYYLIFGAPLAGRPRDKLLFLGAALGLDLLQAETMERGFRR
jgi:hypothetical protein